MLSTRLMRLDAARKRTTELVPGGYSAREVLMERIRGAGTIQLEADATDEAETFSYGLNCISKRVSRLA